MAEIERINVVFSAEFTELQRSVERISASAKGMTDAMQRNADTAASAQKRMADATDLAQRSLRIAAQAATALGIAFAGMKISEAVKDATLAAARFETMGVVLGRLAQNTSYSQRQIQEFAVGVEAMGITMTGSREIIARMIQAQIDLSSATKLARVAQDAAVIGNINSSEALERMVYAITSAQPEMLRTIGLNVNFEQSYARLAQTMNKPVEALSEMEKAQARLASTLQAGAGVAGSYEAAMGTAGKQLLSMQRYVDDLSTRIGQVFLPAFTSLVFQAANGMKNLNASLSSASGASAIREIGEALKVVADNAGAVLIALAAGLGVTLVSAAAQAVASLGLVRLAVAGIAAAFSGWTLVIAAAATAVTWLLTRQSSLSGAQERLLALTGQQAQAEGTLSAAQRARAEQEAMIAVRAEQAKKRMLEADLALVRQEAQRLAQVPSRQTFAGRRLPSEVAAMGPPSVVAAREALGAFLASDQSAEAVRALNERMKELASTTGAGSAAFSRYEQQVNDLASALTRGNAELDATSRKIDELAGKVNQPGQGLVNAQQLQADAARALEGLGLKVFQGGVTTTDMAKSLGLGPALQTSLAQLEAGLSKIQEQAAQMPDGTAAWNAKMVEARGLAEQINIIMAAWPQIMRALAAETETAFTRAERAANDNLDLAGVLNPVARARIQAGQRARDMIADPQMLPGAPEAERAARLTALAMKDAAAAAKDYGANLGAATQQAEVAASFARRIAEAEAEGGFAVRQARAEMELLLEASSATGNVAAATARARQAEEEAIGRAVAQARILAREASEGVAKALALLQGPQQAAALAREQERQRLLREIGPNQPGGLSLGMAAFDSKQIEAAATAMAEIGVQAQKNILISKAELTAIGATASEREKIVALAQLQAIYDEAIKNATGEQAASLTQAYEAASKLLENQALLKQQIEAAARVQQAMKQVGDAIGTAFSEAIIQGKNLTQVMNSLLNTLLQIFAKQFIFEPFSQLLSGLGTSLLSGILGGGGGVIKEVVKAAQGNVFSGPVVPFARGGLINGPMIFPMAQGAGIAGEAGPEAIFPIVRTRSGNLGVRAINDNGGGRGQQKVEVNVYAPPGSDVQQERQGAGDMEQINVFIDQAVARNMRQGTKTHNAIRNTFGARQQVVAR